MFRKEFADVISNTGMVPLRDLRPLMSDNDSRVISERGLLDLNFFDDIKFAKLLADKYKLTFIDLTKAKVSDSIISSIKKNDAVKYRAIPIQKTSKAVTMAIFDPSIIEEKSELQTAIQSNVEFILTNLTSWFALYSRLSVSVDELIDSVKEVKKNTDDQTTEIKAEDIGDDVIKFVNRVLAEAYTRKASDIHIEPYEKDFRIRLRIDGTLYDAFQPPMKLKLPLISRIKIMADMDISEKRKPQDGRIKLEIGGAPIDYRVSSLPTLFGEKIVLRLLDSSNLELDMTKLGFESAQLKVFKDAIHQPYGMVLVTGPTGSGKTTTLYSALADLNKVEKNISTAEDPVEFNLMGINQVNVNKEAGLTFASSLKSFLRQDPDIIMVGEIRDHEVGEIAIEAALTGHLVLSTLHTNDAAGTITRIINMGIEPFLVTGSLNAVVAQRLCRRICGECKTEVKVTKEELLACGFGPNSSEKVKVYKGKGCGACKGLGFKGRVAIYEVLDVSPKVKEIILANGSASQIKMQAIKEGMKTLRMSALTKVALGDTTLEEAVSNSASDRS